VDRNLLGRGADGEVEAQNVGWLTALIKQRVLPVVSALVEKGDGTTREVDAAAAVAALARAFEASFDPVACALTTTDQPGLLAAGGVQEEAPIDALGDEVANPAAVRRLHTAGVPVLVTNLQGLLDGDGPTGTRLRDAA
jgi:acetylglutamate kinase